MVPASLLIKLLTVGTEVGVTYDLIDISDNTQVSSYTIHARRTRIYSQQGQQRSSTTSSRGQRPRLSCEIYQVP